MVSRSGGGLGEASLCVLPHRFEGLDVKAFEGIAPLQRNRFHRPESRIKASDGTSEGIFGGSLEVATDARETVENVTQLTLHGGSVALCDGFLELGHLFVDFVQHARDVRPVESHARRFLTLPVGPHQSGCSGRNAVEPRTLPPLLRFHSLPAGEARTVQVLGVGAVYREHMGVTSDHLVDDALHDGSPRSVAAVFRDLDEHQDIEEEVSQLPFEGRRGRARRGGRGVQSLQHLVGLFQQEGPHRAQSLRAVPRAALVAPKAGHQIHELM